MLVPEEFEGCIAIAVLLIRGRLLLLITRLCIVRLSRPSQGGAALFVCSEILERAQTRSSDNTLPGCL